jgi:hypothetical protein
MGAGAALTAELLMGCSSPSAPSTPAEQASASAAQASKSYEDAKSNEPQFAETYNPNGTREVQIFNGGWVMSHFVEFCLNTAEVGVSTVANDGRAGTAVAAFADPSACQDGRITPEDHLPLPADK